MRAWEVALVVTLGMAIAAAQARREYRGRLAFVNDLYLVELRRAGL